ncbi:MAG TPA: TonB-dependent receptor [Gemmatimonadales bacterium]|nr:TonB-dependent receptor [Gemmatimonadales bacterium]
MLSLFTLAAMLATQGPTGTITGRVLAAGSELPIAEAIVTVEGIEARATTTASGMFRLGGIPPGIYTVRAVAVGYAPAVRTDVAVGTARPVEIAFLLSPRPIELAELSVEAAPYFTPPGTGEPTTRALGPEEIRRAPGVQEDVVRAVALLPGVGVTTAARNDLVVRGGAPFENLFVVDHLEVPNLNHFGSQGSTGGPVSLLDLDFVEQAEFSAGGFGARYGNRVGSATEITLREGNGARLAGTLNLSATGFGAAAEGPLGSQGSFLLSARRSYLDLLFDLAGFNFLPRYYDLQWKVTRRLGLRDQVSWTTVGALDHVGFNNATASDRYDNSRILRLDQDQYFSALTWRHSGDRSRLNVTLGRVFTRFDTFQDDSLGQRIFRNRSTEGETSLSAELLRELDPAVTLTTGLGARYAGRLDYRITLPGFVRTDGQGVPSPLSVDTSFTALRLSGWTEARVRLGPRVRAALGGRVEHYGYLRRATRAAPRASLTLDAGRTSFTLSGGRYWQAPSYIWLVGDTANAGRLEPFRADQVVAGVERRLRGDLRLQFQLYYKRYGDYPARVFRPQAVLAPAGFEDVKSDIPFGLEPLVSTGRGRAYGAELFLQKKLSAIPLYGLVSVSLGRSEFTGLDGVERAGAFDTRVIGNLLLGWRPNAAWELSGKFRVASGLPTTPYVTAGPSAGRLDFTRYNAGPRLPTFHALDFRADRRWNWRGVQLVTYLDVQNIYNRKNVSQFTWNERKQRVEADESLGVLPSLGVRVEF